MFTQHHYMIGALLEVRLAVVERVRRPAFLDQERSGLGEWPLIGGMSPSLSEARLKPCRKLGDNVCLMSVEPAANDTTTQPTRSAVKTLFGKRMRPVAFWPTAMSQLAPALRCVRVRAFSCLGSVVDPLGCRRLLELKQVETRLTIALTEHC